MKRIGSRNIFLFLSATLFITLCFSCTDSYNKSSYIPQSFSFWVDNSFRYEGRANYTFYNDTSHDLTGEFHTENFIENYLTIDFSGNTYLQPGSYPMGYDSTTHTNINICYYSNGSHPYCSTTGTLTITSIDTVSNTFSGTFHFIGNYVGYTKNITYGIFDNIIYKHRL